MTSTSPPPPMWAGSTFVNSVWAATGESPEWIADRTDVLLGQLGDALGVTHWDTSRSQRWEGSAAQLVDIVRRNPVHEALPEGEEGEVLPSGGLRNGPGWRRLSGGSEGLDRCGVDRYRQDGP